MSTLPVGTALVRVLAKVRTGGDERVVNVVGARRAVAGDAARVVVPSKPAAFLAAVQFADTRISPDRRGWFQRATSNDSVPGTMPSARALAARPREDRADFRPLLQRRDDRRHARSIGAGPEMNRAFGDDDVRRSVGHAPRERLDQRVQLQLAGMGREPVVGRDDDVRAIQKPLRPQRVLDAADAAVDQRQRLAASASEPMPFACAVPSGSLSHMNVTSGCSSSSASLR